MNPKSSPDDSSPPEQLTFSFMNPDQPRPDHAEPRTHTDEAIGPMRASQFGKKVRLPVEFGRDISTDPDTYFPSNKTSPMISSPRYRHGGDAFQLSRTRVAGEYMGCPCCFVIRAKEGAQNFPFPTFRVNIAHDHRLKDLFDVFRQVGVPAPISRKTGRPLIPFSHPDLEKWRDPLEGGLKWQDPVTQCVVQGAPDDIWMDPETGLLHVVEYKSTYRSDDPELEGATMESYMRQVEFYQFLLRKNGFQVSDRAFVLFVNADPHADLEKEVFDSSGEFYHMPHRPPALRSFIGNGEWIPHALEEISKLLKQDEFPPHSSNCDHARFLQRERCVNTKRDIKKELKIREMSDEMRSRVLAALEPVIFAADEQNYDVNRPVDSLVGVRDTVRARLDFVVSHAGTVDHLKKLLPTVGISKLLQKKIEEDLDMLASHALQRSFKSHSGTFTQTDVRAEAALLLQHDITQWKAFELLKKWVGRDSAGAYAREYLDTELLRLVREHYPKVLQDHQGRDGGDSVEVLTPESVVGVLGPYLKKIMAEADLYGHAKNRIKTFGLHWKRQKEMLAPLADSIRDLREDCKKAYDFYIRFTVLSEIDEKMFLMVAREYLMSLEESFGLEVPVVDTMIDLLPKKVRTIATTARMNKEELNDVAFMARLDAHLAELYVTAKAFVTGREYIEQHAKDEPTRQRALEMLETTMQERSPEVTQAAVPDDFVNSVLEAVKKVLA